MITQYRKIKCDCCDKEEEIVEGSFRRPPTWLEISVTKWIGNSGDGIYNKEVCSKKCAIKMMNNVKKLPEKTSKSEKSGFGDFGFIS